MNLTRVLNNALPDIPARKLAEAPPRLDPGTTFREHLEEGRPVVRIYVPSTAGMYTFEKNQWELTRLFDGKRSYAEIARLYSQQTGAEYDADTVREFAANLEASDFWYKTPQEKNIQLMQMNLEERKKKLKKKNIWADLSDVDFPAFNPDPVVTWVYNKTSFIYTTWFTVASGLAVLFSMGITVAHWPQIWSDSVKFYFWDRSWTDIFYLYTVGLGIVALHEFAHAHACKHCGGRVPAMGFALVYLLPAFYTDTTEGFVHATFYQRLMISFAGVWSEMLLYAVATPVWWVTQPGTLVHDAAYFVMILCGLMNLVVNWNPLLKLDGYYMLCDIAGINNLKEESTAYTSAWVKKYIWRLPVEVPYIPKRRRFGFAVYALLSGAYSYMILFIMARFTGNIVRNFSPEWGFIPEIGVAALIFRSRIRLLVNFMKFLYLDKKDRIVAWFTPRHTAMMLAGVALLLAIPVWKESVMGRFVLEPVHEAVVRAHVPGKIEQIFVQEGETVSKGEPLAVLSSLPMESDLGGAQARLQLASAEAREAGLKYHEVGKALRQKEEMASEYAQVSERNAALDLKAPISGTIVTPRVQDQLGAYLKAGTDVLEIADLSEMRARIYTSEYDMYKIHAGEEATIQVDGKLRRRRGEVAQISTRPTEPPAGAAEASAKDSSGDAPHQYFFVDIVMENPGKELKPGMTGIARIYGGRRSLGGLALETMKNFWGRKLW
jgi:putative peptide zinc metalloprotease protein